LEKQKLHDSLAWCFAPHFK